MGDAALLLGIAQTTEALTFGQTHVIDEDFRAHGKATMGTLRPLQAEERSRINQSYGPRAPSPDFLATQLLAIYRGEAASVQLAKESGDPANFPTAITAMSNAQCRTFKKEMKQRIHEWEGSVREVTGQADVLAEQKAPLRSIYELYKAGKNKVVGTDSVGRGVSASLAGPEPSQPMSQSVRVSAAVAEDMSRVSGPGPGGSVGRLSTSTVRSSGPSEPPPSRPSQSGAPATAAAAPAAASFSSAPPAAAATPASPAHDRAEVVGNRIQRIQLGTAPVDGMTTDDLQAEKRRLKQVLHKFESDFAALYGEPPTRRDRRSFSAEYHRYGMLKTELAKREGGK